LIQSMMWNHDMIKDLQILLPLWLYS